MNNAFKQSVYVVQIVNFHRHLTHTHCGLLQFQEIAINSRKFQSSYEEIYFWVVETLITCLPVYIRFPAHIKVKKKIKELGPAKLPYSKRIFMYPTRLHCTDINPTELAVFEHKSHIRPNPVSGWVPVPDMGG